MRMHGKFILPFLFAACLHGCSPAIRSFTATPLTVNDPDSVQLRPSSVTNKFTMGGFVESFLTEREQTPNLQSAPMGFFGSREVPVTSFVAKTFCTCDNWFASLPSSTQPNRTFAFTGDSSIFRTHLQLIKTADTLFHWLERNKIRWRVYPRTKVPQQKRASLQ